MNRKLWESLTSLYGVHAFNYLIPLVTLPYMARCLGPAEWGALAFADAYGRVVGLFVEYGFGLSATREVACVRHDPEARGRCLSGVFGAQLMLGACALLITAALARMIPVFATHIWLLPGAFFLAMSQGASPMWYFQAIERVRLMGSVWIVGRIAGAAGLFLFVRSPGDGPLALLIQATAPALSVIVGVWIAYRDTPFSWPSFTLGWKALRSGGHLFAFRAGTTLYTAVNVLLLGFLAPPVTVAWFAGAEKIARAAVAGSAPISQAFYPRINHLLTADRYGATQAFRMSMRLMLAAGTGFGIVVFFGAPLLVRLLLGKGFEQSIPVLRILALLPPLIALSNVFGSQWMLALRLERELNWIILSAGVLNVVLSIVLGRLYQHMGVAVSVVLAEVFVIAATVIVLRRRHLDPWNAIPVREEELTLAS
jgi:PST family polysaccharide transporter